MAAKAEIIHVQEQDGYPTLWAVTDLDYNHMNERTFRVVGTGTEIPDDCNKHTHIGTCVMKDGYVWHIFEVTYAA